MKTGIVRRFDLSYLQNVHGVVQEYRQRNVIVKIAWRELLSHDLQFIACFIHLVTRIRENLIMSSKIVVIK